MTHSIHTWIVDNAIKNEKGDRIDFRDHLFLFDIYADCSKYMVVMKCAQAGLSTLEIIKNHFDALQRKMDIIYTLPTDSDVRLFVGGKVNRIIANNPSMLADVADKDSIEQKQVGGSMIYFRGTWTAKAAIMITADRLVHDEKDSSKLDIVEQFKARIQHSKIGEVHTFSHPSLPSTGVHSDWEKSDQKEWFIQCGMCKQWQYLMWDMENPSRMSVDIDRKIFVCRKKVEGKLCRAELTREMRRCGRWIARYPGRDWSGYHVSLLMAPWKTAADIVAAFQEPNSTLEFFYNKVLGLPYADGKSKLLKDDFLRALTGENYAPKADDRVVIGIDTGLRLDYVMGNSTGLFYQGDCDDYNVLDGHMERWKNAIAVIDQGGDLIGSRKFHARWPGRVFLLAFGGEMKGMELAKWGKSDEHGSVMIDRNRVLQLVVDEIRAGRIPIHGTEEDWYEYWLDWNHLAKAKVLDPETNQVKGYKWIRSGRDHRALATACWRTGMMRFGKVGGIIEAQSDKKRPDSYMIDPDLTVSFDPEVLFNHREEQEDDGEWRK
jgi:hypothetical protein